MYLNMGLWETMFLRLNSAKRLRTELSFGSNTCRAVILADGAESSIDKSRLVNMKWKYVVISPISPV